jgi:hypothetical protein
MNPSVFWAILNNTVWIRLLKRQVRIEQSHSLILPDDLTWLHRRRALALVDVQGFKLLDN